MSTTSSLRWANAWADGATDIPSGAILNVCLVMANTLPVYMTELEISNDILSIVFSQNGEPVAYGNTRDGDDVLFLDVAGSCLYAALELGALEGLEVRSTSSVKINPSNVLVTEPVSYDKAKVTVTQDGVKEETSLYSDYELRVDPRLSVEYDEEDKAVIISLGEEEHRGLLDIFISVDPPISKVMTINHVRPDLDGFVDVYISTTAGELSFSKSATMPIITISPTITPCGATTDVIDKYIAPDVVRSFPYMPLDDAYDKGADGGYIRNTSKNLIQYNKLDPRYDIIETSQNI